MTEFVALSDLVTTLKSATAGGRSGAFFITTDKQQSAMVTMDGGRISGVKFRSASGYDAAHALAQVGQPRYQSAAEPTELSGPSDIETATVLEILDSGVSAANGEETARATLDLEALRERYVEACSAAAAARFEQAIADAGAWARTADGFRQVVQRLSELIGDTGQEAAFRRESGLEGQVCRAPDSASPETTVY